MQIFVAHWWLDLNGVPLSMVIIYVIQYNLNWESRTTGYYQLFIILRNMKSSNY